MFTDPFSKTGGDKCSYSVPTYEALKGIARSIYWKPTFIWDVLRVRVLNSIQTESRNVKPLCMDGGNSLAIYNCLSDVAYQVDVRFVWNMNRPFESDRIDGKHYAIARKMIEKGGRRDIFLGSRECQGYVEPCEFGEGKGFYDDAPDMPLGVMFHGFSYPDESGVDELRTRFWRPVMRKGVIDFIRPEECTMTRFIRKMKAVPLKSCGLEEEALRHELD